MFRPEGLPDHLLGKTNEETLTNVFKAFDGLRRNEGERGAVPKDAAGYKLDFGDKVKPYVTNFDKDPVYKETLAIAHEAGLTDKQLNKFLPKLLEKMVDGGLVEAPVDANAQLLSLAPPGQYADDKAKSAAAAKRVNDNIAWVDVAKSDEHKTFGSNSKQIGEFLAAAVASDPRAHLAIEWLRGKENPVGPAINLGGGGGGGGGGLSDADLQARLNSPKNNPNHNEFDRAYAQETDRLYQQRYG